MTEINISKVEQEISGILMLGDDITANLITLLKAKQTEIDGLKADHEGTKRNLTTLESRVNELDGFLNEYWEEMNHLGINEDIAKIFKLEIEQETEVSFTISATATIKHTRGTNLEDMDMTELVDADIVTVDHRYEVQNYDINSIRAD